MDNETLAAISRIAETITSVGILLVWVWAERRDNKEAWKIISELVRLRLRQIETDKELPEDKEHQLQDKSKFTLP